MNQPLRKVQETIASMGLDALLVTGPENRRYLSGFSGTSGYLLISKDKALLITDFRYFEQAAKQASAFEVVKAHGIPEETLINIIRQSDFKSLGFEADHLTYQQYKNYKEKLFGTALTPTREIIEKFRETKNSSELQAIYKAVEIADKAFEHILGYLKPGIKERDVANELEYFMKKMGSDRPAFDSIVASGARAALPHGVASEKILEKGDLVVLDFGAVYQGYHSDITRTVVLGKASEQQKNIYETVLEAQLRAIDKIKPGVTCMDVDAVARNFITEKGYGSNFGHGLGHSVGLAIHEKPSLAPRDSRILTQGNVVTVEPGIYIEGWGGVRIEDIVTVTEDSAIVITKATKKLYEL